MIAYHYGPGGLLLAESTGGGAPIREYVWLGDLLVAQIEAAGPALYFVHADHLGTPDKLTDATKAIVWDAALTPWGEVETQGGMVQVNIRLPGQYHDQETGLSYNWHRDYDPTTGRYMQSDPIGLEGGINRYAYVGGSPVSLADPTGENPIVWFVAGAAADVALQLAFKCGDWRQISFLQAGLSGLMFGMQALRPVAAMLAVGRNAFSGINAIPKGGAAGGVAGTLKGLGNIGSHGVIDAGRALGAGQKWLGAGYKEIAPGVFRSADGVRQFRMTNADILGSHGKIGSHVHFEALNDAGKVIENLHLPVTP